MAEFLGVVELGTLYKDGEELPLPTRPWYSGEYPGSLSGRGKGNTPKFTSLKNMSKWVIGNTSSKAENKLKWIKIKDEDKVLYICDRVILDAVSWNDLNGLGYVTGKNITIDGIKYQCRLLTGGNNLRRESDRYSGGNFPNEWDKYITNEGNIIGLSKPSSSDLDKTLNYNDLDGSHNQLWHWWGSYSFCKEISSKEVSNRIIRGYHSARYFGYNTLNSYPPSAGWRPVLEELEAPKYKKYLIKQNNQYYSIKPEFYDSEKGQYKPIDKNFKDNGFNNIEDLTKKIEGFRPIDKFKGKIEILKQDEK